MIQIGSDIPESIYIGSTEGAPVEAEAMYIGNPDGSLTCIFEKSSGMFADGFWRDDEPWVDADFWRES